MRLKRKNHTTMCPDTTLYVSSCCYMCRLTPIYVSVLLLVQNRASYDYMPVLVLLHICPHTTIYLSSYYYLCVLILLYMCLLQLLAENRASDYYICVLVLLYMCPHATMRHMRF